MQDAFPAAILSSPHRAVSVLACVHRLTSQLSWNPTVWLMSVCVCCQRTKPLQHMQAERWHSTAAGLCCFLSKRSHPCSTIARLLLHLPSFLPPWPLTSQTGGVAVGTGLSARSSVRRFGRGVRPKQRLTCALERRRVMGEKFLEIEVQVTGF